MNDKDKEQAILEFIDEPSNAKSLLEIEGSLGIEDDPFTEEFSVIKKTRRE